ncbi:MAG: hypothetical protein EHM59_13285, partial [Betaproteobacteria bacterium]
MRIMACAALLLCSVLPALGQAETGASPPPRKTLLAFSSDAEILDLFNTWSRELKRRLGEARKEKLAAGEPSALAAPASAAKSAEAQAAVAGAAQESVTNVQHAGVDEGGIVKVHGDHLVVLRRGRLFTVAIRDGQLRAVASVDAYGDGIDPRGAWYDELLVSGNTVVVIGYSYARGGTEIGVFEISPAGALRHKATYHLRSNDYFSSRNYASHLIGTRLVFYTPLR